METLPDSISRMLKNPPLDTNDALKPLPDVGVTPAQVRSMRSSSAIITAGSFALRCRITKLAIWSEALSGPADVIKVASGAEPPKVLVAGLIQSWETSAELGV